MYPRTPEIISLAIIALIAIALIVFLPTPPVRADAPTQPEWQGDAAYANRACWRHGLVRQIEVGWQGEVDAVCMDGWAVNLHIP